MGAKCKWLYGTLNGMNLKKVCIGLPNLKPKSLVHQWRSEEPGILVGRRTIETDNPQLTCRLVDGKHPTRIIIDGKANLSPNNYEIGSGRCVNNYFECC